MARKIKSSPNIKIIDIFHEKGLWLFIFWYNDIINNEIVIIDIITTHYLQIRVKLD